MDDQRELLRHFVAALSYRLKRVTAGAPENFGEFKQGEARTPTEILHHINDLLRFANGRFRAQATQMIARGPWADELKIFSLQASDLDHALLELPLKGVVNGRPMTLEQLLHGPLCDAMTHVGQIALLRRLAGSPLTAENYVRADIRAGRLD
ncbi:MAG: hypothetical protein HUU03_10555 [Planctomycetaceae bacterium]|nr:hypothetical protein [Planctomycetota bacterium]MCQ3948561.1 hypothetical protein [Planctomycetota bacterium]NUO16867.1 hypothetical protein [Planctomycetaceae bacterium]GIK52024.1 MAG: hypothetical protein BroJett014_09970 [Planctomycetota bacterium]HRJ77425.1 hypothetical protein [Planctomycetota bacterium]